ncbi:MAG: hypothetical protein GC179_26130 [Anaerolineaceae bacterium]|nr:hypothetical protein [Anaerolineaceae bacterium]
MKPNRLALAISVLVFISAFRMLAQSDTVKLYSAKDVAWRTHATVDYTAGPKGANAFLNVSADADGKVYVANYSNILIIDAKTGKTLGTLVDKTGTIKQYNDIEVTKDGNFWIADSRSSVYLVDSTGKILSTVPFHTSEGFSEGYPGEIELDTDGNLYVSYSGVGVHFQVFTPEGEYVRSIITGADKLQGVSYFDFAPDGTLFFLGFGIGWISEEDGKATVHEFAPEFMKEQKFIQYRGFDIDYDGNFYFSAGSDPDKATSIFKLDKEGKLLAQYGQAQERQNWGKDFGTDELSFTVSLALASDGALIISDTNNTYSQLIKVNMQD